MFGMAHSISSTFCSADRWPPLSCGGRSSLSWRGQGSPLCQKSQWKI